MLLIVLRRVTVREEFLDVPHRDSTPLPARPPYSVTFWHECYNKADSVSKALNGQGGKSPTHTGGQRLRAWRWPGDLEITRDVSH